MAKFFIKFRARITGPRKHRPIEDAENGFFSTIKAISSPVYFFCNAFILLILLLCISGCQTTVPKGKSPLMPVQMSCDSVVLEMFFVRVPFGDQKANVKLWDEIDEQRFSPELREKLAQNGFRVGIIDGQISSELASLLQLADKPPPNELERTKVSEQELTEQPKVVRRHLQLRAGQRSEIIASGVYDSLPLLKQEQGQLCGQTYNQAQGIFAVKAIPQLDGQVRLELLPELHHDQPRQRWVGNQGMLRLESGRPREEFSDMAIRIDMAPGAMLILSSLPNRPGSLGHYFFTENTGKLEQKVLIIRISQTQQDGLFNVPEASETTDPNAKNS